jgi:threonyl-tRNA synthetase
MCDSCDIDLERFSIEQLMDEIIKRNKRMKKQIVSLKQINKQYIKTQFKISQQYSNNTTNNGGYNDKD